MQPIMGLILFSGIVAIPIGLWMIFSGRLNNQPPSKEASYYIMYGIVALIISVILYSW